MTTAVDPAELARIVANEHIHSVHVERGFLVPDCLECRSAIFVRESSVPGLTHKYNVLTIEPSDPIFAYPACRAIARPS